MKYLTSLAVALCFTGCASVNAKSVKNASSDAVIINSYANEADKEYQRFKYALARMAYVASTGGPGDRYVRFDASKHIAAATGVSQEVMDSWRPWSKKLRTNRGFDDDTYYENDISDPLYLKTVKDLYESRERIEKIYEEIKKKQESIQTK